MRRYYDDGKSKDFRYAVISSLRKKGKLSIADLLKIVMKDPVFSNTTKDGYFSEVIINLLNAKFISIFFDSEDISEEEGEEFLRRYIRVGSFRASLSDGYDFARRVNPDKTYVQITDYFYKIQEIIGFSVSDGLSMHADWECPALGVVNENLKTQVFVIMPFIDKLNQVYEDHILKVCKKIGYECKRADDIFLPNIIINDIWSLINNSDVIICDCTGRNPNVFYELGLAHAIGRNVICLTQNDEDIPFDIKHIRYIKYDFTPRGMAQFEETLEQYLAISMTEAIGGL
jgi:hypothetical protein